MREESRFECPVRNSRLWEMNKREMEEEESKSHREGEAGGEREAAHDTATKDPCPHCVQNPSARPRTLLDLEETCYTDKMLSDTHTSENANQDTRSYCLLCSRMAATRSQVERARET